SPIFSFLYRKEFLSGCGGVEEGILVAADDVWRKYFLLPMGISGEDGKHIGKHDDLSLTLQNPFQACFRYEKTSETNEILVGTYMIETRDCH
ncbi:hypothetical protein Y032_0317g2299, partial [Ancylostoma ceylanicum]